ncbi:TBC domain-containing protein [Cryptosporidium felis]|nr:TBC domain-containing protein [Cryptosporidium felis]
MDPREQRNIVTLLAVDRAYGFFVPNLNNVASMQTLKDNTKSDGEGEVSGTESSHSIRRRGYDRKKLSFVRFLAIEGMRPHCDCEKDDQGRCRRMQEWLEVSRSGEFGLEGVYRELISIVEYIVRMDGSEMVEIDLAGTAVVNRLFNNKVMNSIYMDVCRTYPSVSYFKHEGKSHLSKILLVYSLMDLDVGYVQGMNFLVGCILWHSSSEQEAFRLLASLMFNYGMREMFVSGLPGLRVKCRILDQLLEKELYSVWDHITKQGGTVDMLATDWFLTLFSYSIPLNVIGRFWDDFFTQGWTPIYKLIIYRLQRIQSDILSSNDIADLMNAIKYSTPSSKSGIFGNALLNFRDEIGKSNFGRLFSQINSYFNSGGQEEGSEDGDDCSSEVTAREEAEETEAFSSKSKTNFNNLTNDPNIISLPHVWNELILEAQFEVDLDVNFIQELETALDSDGYLELGGEGSELRKPNGNHLNMQSFEYSMENREIKEKEEQDERTIINTSHLNDEVHLQDLNTPRETLKSAARPCLQSKRQLAKSQIIRRYRDHYSNIFATIFNDDLSPSHGQDEKEESAGTSRSILEVKDKLKSSLDKLLAATEKLLEKSISKEHLKELNERCIEVQKNKFGPWSHHG